MYIAKAIDKKTIQVKNENTDVFYEITFNENSLGKEVKSDILSEAIKLVILSMHKLKRSH